MTITNEHPAVDEHERAKKTIKTEDNNILYFGQNASDAVWIGGRASDLALVQSRICSETLKEAYPEKSFPYIGLKTLGDKVQSKALYTFGGKALWTRELEYLLLRKQNRFSVETSDNIDNLPADLNLDVIVNCLKDMPTQMPKGCKIGAIMKREDPRDAFVSKAGLNYKSLADLPDGSVVGTSSIRRSAQISRLFPKLKFQSVRGNLQTRLRKLDDENSDYKCLILAAAGLIRMDLEERISSFLDPPEMYWAVGQGALALEIREGDAETLNIISHVHDTDSAIMCAAERSLMRKLEGGCSVPLGVQTFMRSDELVFRAMVVSDDGTTSVRGEITKVVSTEEEADQMGRELAQQLLDQGAQAILDSIKYEEKK